MRKGDKVRVNRDETKHPSRGTWPRFRGKRGVFVTRNGDEYGVSFNADDEVDAWFKRYELEVV